MAKSNSYSAREISKHRSRLLRKNWWLLALWVVLVIGAFGAAASFRGIPRQWIDPDQVTAFLLGLGVATAIATTAVLMGMDGARGHRQGLQAEVWTAKLFKRLRRDGWTVVNNIEFKAENIDHVLLGPKGAIAVETKFSDAGWTLTSPDRSRTRFRDRSWRKQVLDQAHHQARKLTLLLKAGGVDTEVLPVLVLWGRNLGGDPTAVIDGVVVGFGNEPQAWLSQLRSIPLSDEQLHLARDAIQCRKAGTMVRKPRRAPATRAVASPGVRSHTPLPSAATDRAAPVPAGYR